LSLPSSGQAIAELEQDVPLVRAVLAGDERDLARALWRTEQPIAEQVGDVGESDAGVVRVDLGSDCRPWPPVGVDQRGGPAGENAGVLLQKRHHRGPRRRHGARTRGGERRVRGQRQTPDSDVVDVNGQPALRGQVDQHHLEVGDLVLCEDRREAIGHAFAQRPDHDHHRQLRNVGRCAHRSGPIAPVAAPAGPRWSGQARLRRP
jgi:hypothetical protein